MRFLQWNDLLFEYYFGNGDAHEVFLGIDKDSLIDYVIDRGVFDAEFNAYQMNNPGVRIGLADYIWKDFTKLFRGRNGCSKSHFLNTFKIRIAESDQPASLPTVFPYIALLIMPLANHPEMDAKNFYDRVSRFLQDNFIINRNETLGSSDMRSFDSPSLRMMWENLEVWAAYNNYSYRLKDQAYSTYKYVGPFMAEALLTATQRDKFKFIFYEAGLTPDMELTDEQIVRILNTYHRCIGFNDNAVWDRLFGHSSDLFIGVFKRKYQEWNGDTIIRVHENNRSLGRDSGSNKKLYLCFQEFRGAFSFFLKARLPDSENGSEYEYQSNTFPDYSFHISVNGYAEESYCPDNLTSIIATGDQIVLHEAGNTRNKMTFANEDFFLFEKYFGLYSSSCKIKLGGSFYFMVRRDKLPEYTEWLSCNNATPKRLQGPLGDHYIMYWIQSVLEPFPSHSMLNCIERPSAHLVNTFILYQEQGVRYLYQNLPVFFDIDGVNIETDNIRAVFDSPLADRCRPLQYNNDSRLWVLPAITNTVLRRSCFHLYCNEVLISKDRFSFADFNQISDDSYQEIGYDSWGNYTDTDTVVNGLTLSRTTGPAFGLEDNMKTFGKPPVINNEEYTPNEYLLYWLSSNARTDKDRFTDAINVQIQNSLSEIGSAGKWQIDTILNNYCRLGYINYAYSEGKHIIAPNKPTLILLPARIDVKPFGTNWSPYCIDSFYSAFFTGARTPEYTKRIIRCAKSFVGYNNDKIRVQIETNQDPIYPQRIIFWASTLSTISSFAEKYGLGFQRTVYANDLLRLLGSVEEYKQHILQNDSFKDTFEGFTDLRCINYAKLSDLVLSNQSSIKSFQVSSSSFDPKCSIVTYFPGKYMEKTIFWYGERQYPIDKLWGHFVGMSISHSKVAVLDEVSPGHPVIKLPYLIKLPLLYARALTLITGEIPQHWQGRRIYRLCDNPFTGAMAPEAILNKLNQL